MSKPIEIDLTNQGDRSEGGAMPVFAGRSAAPSGLSPCGSQAKPAATIAKVERLALNLRAYAYAMGAPRRDTDEEVALGAARLILPILESIS